MASSLDLLNQYCESALNQIYLLISHCDNSYDEVLTYKNILFKNISYIINNKIFDILLYRGELDCFERLEELYLDKKNIKIKVTGKLHLWDWQEFKEEIHGDIVDYENNGNIILSITYVVSTLPNDYILKKYGLSYSIL